MYISCSPKAALRNWVDLSRPASKAYKGQPFVATAAVGVDMFPHTHHKEMVLLFERVVDEEVPLKVEAGSEVETAVKVEPESVETNVKLEADNEAAEVKVEVQQKVIPAEADEEDDVGEPAAKVAKVESTVTDQVKAETIE